MSDRLKPNNLPDITQDERIRRSRANRAIAALRTFAARWVVLGGTVQEAANLCGLTVEELEELTGG